MDQFIAALLGALVGGLVTIFGAFKLDTHQRNKRRDNLRAAVAVEIASLVELVTRQQYSSHMLAFCELITKLDPDKRHSFHLPIKQSYFTIYETNASSIGDLTTQEAAKIIGFYQQARSIIDSVIDQEFQDPTITNVDIANHYKDISIFIDNLCVFGMELVEELATKKVIDQINATAFRLTQRNGTNLAAEVSK